MIYELQARSSFLGDEKFWTPRGRGVYWLNWHLTSERCTEMGLNRALEYKNAKSSLRCSINTKFSPCIWPVPTHTSICTCLVLVNQRHLKKIAKGFILRMWVIITKYVMARMLENLFQATKNLCVCDTSLSPPSSITVNRFIFSKLYKQLYSRHF